ncbi:MAG: winged helix-turn-helix domain-containing protein, partial [Chloroflexia bacterium]|nr:winged helix-turn-helix domain-containing protein [Chloroflexia bacterium]
LMTRPRIGPSSTIAAIAPPGSAEVSLTLDEARQVAVAAHGLGRRQRGPVTKDRIREVIARIGCLQLDTINVISRSHETVVWSRVGPYDPRLLAELHDPDGELMEYWAHAAALVPTWMFPLFRRTMEDYGARPGWQHDHAGVLDRVLGRVREGGPVRSADFDREAGPRPDAWDWWGGKPDRRALDALWTRGDLMVLKREGFQRTYELTERLLPERWAGPPPPLAEQHLAFTRIALGALGIATARWSADYFRTGGRAHVPAKDAAIALETLVEEGIALRAQVEGIAEPAWLATVQVAHLDALRAGRDRPTLATLLSPFDNLVWFRPRTLALFGFHYRLESYTPAEKRQYGYYTLPILVRGRLVGRLDPSLDRKAGILTIRALHLEPGVRPSAVLAVAIAGALRDLATFLGAREVAILPDSSPEMAAAVAAAL